MKVNKKNNHILFILLFLLSFFLLIQEVKALDIVKPDNELIIEDDADILTISEEENLKNDMKPLLEYGNIAFKSITENSKTAKEFTEEYYTELFNNESGTIFLFDMEHKAIYIYSYGNCYKTITETVAQTIIDRVSSYASNGEYYKCSSETYQEILSYYKPNTKETEANGYTIVIEDDADLLSAEEEIKLKDKMKSLTKYGHIAFKSISDSGISTEQYARNYYYGNFRNESGTLFLIDMYNRKIYIFSDGSNYDIITTGKAEIITDNIYKYASRGEYYECTYNAYSQMETLLAGEKIVEPMRYISNIVVSLVLGFFINFAIVLSLTKIKKAKNTEILKDCDINFIINDVFGKKTGTHRTYSPQDSGGSSSGGGGGGGGGSSGGGGGHSF